MEIRTNQVQVNQVLVFFLFFNGFALYVLKVRICSYVAILWINQILLKNLTFLLQFQILYIIFESAIAELPDGESSPPTPGVHVSDSVQSSK